MNSCLGLESLVVKPEEARRVSALIDAIYESSEQGTSVKIK